MLDGFWPRSGVSDSDGWLRTGVKAGLELFAGPAFGGALGGITQEIADHRSESGGRRYPDAQYHEQGHSPHSLGPVIGNPA